MQAINGNFPKSDTSMSSRQVFGYSLTSLAVGMRDHTNRVQYGATYCVTYVTQGVFTLDKAWYKWIYVTNLDISKFHLHHLDVLFFALVRNSLLMIFLQHSVEISRQIAVFSRNFQLNRDRTRIIRIFEGAFFDRRLIRWAYCMTGSLDCTTGY